MPKDYAKSNSSRSRSSSRSSRGRRSASNKSGGKLWLWVLILIVLFAGCLYYLKQQSTRLAGLPNAEAIATGTTAKEQELAKKAAAKKAAEKAQATAHAG